MASQSRVIQLTPLLPSPTYALPYALPLLLLSLIFALSGTFLTLDRTRTFPKRGSGAVYASLPVPGSLDPPKKTSKLNWALEGGVGGLIGGYLFGIHLSTALALLIPATTNSAPLSPKSFLAIWILSSVFTTPLAGRYRYATFVFYGVMGGTLTSLALCIIIHPSLPSRTILSVTFLVLFTLVTLALSFIPRLSAAFFHAFLRLCTASTGAFGVTLAISLLLDPREASWANVWERLWVRDGDPTVWATPQERGLSAAWGLFLIFGMFTDWALHRWIGECPDEKWDNYLAQYTTNLPHHSDRAGTFKPFTSVWDRLFPSSSASVPPTPFDFSGSGQKRDSQKETLFPNDADFKAHMAVPFMLHNIPQAPQMGFTKTGMGPAGGKLSKKSKGDEESGLLAANLARGISKAKSKKRKTSGGKIGGFFGRKKDEEISTRAGRKPIKFGGDLSSDSEDDTLAADDDETKRGSVPNSPVVQQKRPGMMRDFSSAATLVDRGAGEKKRGALAGLKEGQEGVDIDYEKEIEMVKDKLRRNSGGIASGKNSNANPKGGADSEVEYSDYEEDLTALKYKSGVRTPQEPESEWVPGFMKRHQSVSPSSHQPPPPMSGHGALPVPATPSLIRAIDRITVAQRDAFGGGTGGLSVIPSRDGSIAVGHAQEATIPVTSNVQAQQERAPRWEEFWREVRHKAQS